MNPAESIAFEINNLRLHDWARYDALVHQLLAIIEGREKGNRGHRGWWKPEDQGFTRSADRAVAAWRNYALKALR